MTTRGSRGSGNSCVEPALDKTSPVPERPQEATVTRGAQAPPRQEMVTSTRRSISASSTCGQEITGYNQYRLRNAASMQERIANDLYYLDHISATDST